MIFILVGLAFKISAVPFHMWTPDVYEGSPNLLHNSGYPNIKFEKKVDFEKLYNERLN